MRGVTNGLAHSHRDTLISTHTPHARRDLAVIYSLFSILSISTHTPHARRDRKMRGLYPSNSLFQLTRLMRGVTTGGIKQITMKSFQLTRLMRGVTF